MILTTCPACAAPLAYDAPRCVRCKLRYCNKTCQHDHWRRGHKQMCKKIHRGGNAEQYNADEKYKEALAAALGAVGCPAEEPCRTFDEGDSGACIYCGHPRDAHALPTLDRAGSPRWNLVPPPSPIKSPASSAG